MEIQTMAMEMPRVDRRGGHPNRRAFRGVLAVVDGASDRAPAGARGHRVLLTRAAAEAALASLLGMGLDFTPSLDAHDARRKVGVITEAFLAPAGMAGAALHVRGYLFARDFPDVVRELRAAGKSLGMSYEVADAKVEDVGAKIWVLTEVTFTGAAVLKKSKAAYGGTWIEIDAVDGSRSPALGRNDWGRKRNEIQETP
jgi:hypothetical protein